MTAPHADQLIDGYLARLTDAAADLPKGARTELIDDMRAHIAEARAREGGDETDATILNILDRLGEPAVVAADARERLGLREAQPASVVKPGLLEAAGLVLLILFWPVGIVLVWISPAWKTTDKLIGTFLPPGGYLTVGVFGFIAAEVPVAQGDQSPWLSALAAIVAVLILILPLLTTAYLAVRLRRASGATSRATGIGVRDSGMSG